MRDIIYLIKSGDRMRYETRMKTDLGEFEHEV
jgi:hypothetical protein